MSEVTNNLAKVSAAYVAAFAEMQHASKDRSNPFFKNDYATLESVLDTVRPILAKHKLAVYQAPGLMQAITPDLVTISVRTILLHESGENLVIETQVPVAPSWDKQQGKAVVDAQRAGSAITYARRYALAAVCGITQTDDDGNEASAVTGASKSDVTVLTKSIKEALTLADLEVLKPAVRAAGDRELIKAYQAREKSLS